MRIVAGLILMVIAVLGAPAWGQNFAGAPHSFRVSWGPRTYGARPAIEGYVHNDSSYWVANVRLRIEGLDAGARAVGEKYVWALGDLPPGDRVYFMAESLPGATTYRINVTSYDLISKGGS